MKAQASLGKEESRLSRNFPRRKFDDFFMQKTVQATRREVGLNLSVACREKLFENVTVEGKNRSELRK